MATILKYNKLCESIMSTRWHCFTTVSSSFPTFLPLSLCWQWEVLIQEFITFPCLCIVSFSVILLSAPSTPLFCLLCVSCEQSHLLRPQVTAGLFFCFVLVFLPCYLVLLDHPILLLFWRGLPGDDDGSPIVPTLSHCNLTRRGTGGWGGRQKEKNVHIWYFPPPYSKCRQSLPAFCAI